MFLIHANLCLFCVWLLTIALLRSMLSNCIGLPFLWCSIASGLPGLVFFENYYERTKDFAKQTSKPALEALDFCGTIHIP